MEHKVRVRNINYALTGSVDIEGQKAHTFRIEPNVWTPVSDEVYEHLKNKFGNPKFSDAPASLPGADGYTYYGYPGQVRAEQSNAQYLIEFA